MSDTKLRLLAAQHARDAIAATGFNAPRVTAACDVAERYAQAGSEEIETTRRRAWQAAAYARWPGTNNAAKAAAATLAEYAAQAEAGARGWARLAISAVRP